MAPLSDKTYRRIAREHKTFLLEDLWEEFRGRAAAIDISLLESETTAGAIERLKQEAVKKIRDGAELLVLTDRTVCEGDRRYLDPHLAVSAVDQALKQFRVEPGEENLRRRCGIVLRSAALRNVHDVMLALGLGANGVCPYVMVEVVCVDDYETDVANLCAALKKGIEKVISTIGIHEVRGYARQFSSIGIKPELAEIFQTAGLRRLRDRRVSASPSSTTTPTRGRGSSPRTGRTRSPRRPSASIPRSTRPRRDRERLRRVRRVLPEGPRPRGAEPDLDAPHHGPEGRSRAGRSGRRRRFGRPSRLPDRDQLDELRLAVRARLPRLRGGRQADQHPLHQRRGRRDPGHVRPLPQVARAAGRLGPVRRLGGDAQLLLRRRDQDRPGRQARRGRPPARQEGLREGRGGAQRLPRNRPDLALQQPRPLFDRGPGRADRRAEDRQSRPARLGQGAGGPEHRHDRAGNRQGRRRHHHPVGLRGRHRRRPPARPAPRRPAVGHRHPRRAPGADGGRDPQPGRDLGRRRLPPRPRRREAALHGRQPGRLRDPGDGLARLHDLPRLPARHLPRRHRDPDRDHRAGPGARAEEVHPAGGRDRGLQAAPASSPRWARR